MNKSFDLYKVNDTDYNFIRLINKGAYGNVFLVEKKSSKEQYAAKIIELDGQELTKQMIEREVQIMMHLNHPTLVKFYGFTKIIQSERESMMLVMKLYKKGSLSELLSDEQKSLAEISYNDTSRQIILVGIAYGMMKLHRKNIIHRDLKPGNILIDEEYHPYITDFGLSKIAKFDKSSKQSKFCGTPMYMAPEVIQNNKYNGKADVYSFGIIMYQVITGLNPFPLFQSKWNEFNLYQFVVGKNGRPSFKNTQIKPSLKNLIESCWDPDPIKRPSFEEIFNKLAYNQDDVNYSLENDEENNYYLDNVSVEDLFDYIDEITKNEDYAEEIEELRAALQSQQRMIDQIKGKTEDSTQVKLLENKIEDQEKIINDYKDQFQKQEDKLNDYVKLFQKQEEIMKAHNEQFEKQEEVIKTL